MVDGWLRVLNEFIIIAAIIIIEVIKLHIIIDGLINFIDHVYKTTCSEFIGVAVDKHC